MVGAMSVLQVLRGPLWEPSLLAMNDNADCLMHRAACIASKLGSYRLRVTGAIP
jgi:hypothetical protein